jgi:hypothetical protein
MQHGSTMGCAGHRQLHAHTHSRAMLGAVARRPHTHTTACRRCRLGAHALLRRASQRTTTRGHATRSPTTHLLHALVQHELALAALLARCCGACGLGVLCLPPRRVRRLLCVLLGLEPLQLLVDCRLEELRLHAQVVLQHLAIGRLGLGGRLVRRGVVSHTGGCVCGQMQRPRAHASAMPRCTHKRSCKEGAQTTHDTQPARRMHACKRAR